MTSMAVELLLGEGDEECPFCGGPVVLDLAEIWGPREFQLETCCEGIHELVASTMERDGRLGAALLKALSIDEICSDSLRTVANDNFGQLVLDWHPRVVSISLSEAKAFILRHHRHNKPPVGWKYGFAVKNGQDVIGVVTVGRPVARMIPHETVVEVNRLCTRSDLAPGIMRNACSMLYGAAAREAKRRGYERIITYTLESEAGSSLKASGWTWDGNTAGGSWSCDSRPRGDSGPTGKKNRWAKVLHSKRSAQIGLFT